MKTPCVSEFVLAFPKGSFLREFLQVADSSLLSFSNSSHLAIVFSMV